jgi:class 3 adenylate cyclase
MTPEGLRGGRHSRPHSRSDADTVPSEYDRHVSIPSERPAQPELRAAAMALEDALMVGQVLDHKWRTVFLSTEQVAVFPFFDVSGWLGTSQIVQVLDKQIPISVPLESRLRWWEALGPQVRHDVPPDDPDFEAVFGPMAPAAREMEPGTPAWATVIEREVRDDEARRLAWHGRVIDTYLRVTTPDGKHVGTLHISRPQLGDVLSARLSRGHTPMYEQMLSLREPARRSAAILFADVEASGELSRGLSSRAYFDLIRSLTDLVDTTVIDHGGLIGKHAGDGASALFVVDERHVESDVVRGAIQAARDVRAGARGLLDGGPDVVVNVGLHWGATLTVGQVSSLGRLEVTALGDEMNEAARIEAVAKGGQILASKNLLERLTPADAEDLGLDPAHMQYAAINSISTDSKAMRDAGIIAVAPV